MAAHGTRPTKTGWFLCQSRVMLVTEKGDELWLAPFVTNNWLRDGMRISVGQAPTRFGAVSYRIDSHAAQGFIEAAIDPPRRAPPKTIVLRLRHPEGKPIRSVTVDGRAHAQFDPQRETINVQPGPGRIHVVASY